MWVCWFGLLSVGWAAPRITAASAPQLQAAAVELRASLTELEAKPSAAGVARAERAMQAIDRALDANFHAPNLTDPKARPHARVLRKVVLELIGGEDPLLTIREDVVRYRPAVAQTMAKALRTLGRTAAAEAWARRAAAASGD